jgi:hypothetical protein
VRPGPLRVAEKRAAGVGVGQAGFVVGLAVAADDAGVERHQLGQVADGERPVHGQRVGGIAQPGRQPLVVGGDGGPQAVLPRAVLVGVVVLGPVAPGVVGDVVVVPDRDHRVAEVQRQQVGVGPGLAEARAVVVEADDLVVGQRLAHVALAAGLIDVVAHVQHQAPWSAATHHPSRATPGARVHSSTESLVGSKLATPWVNGGSIAGGSGAVAVTAAMPTRWARRRAGLVAAAQPRHDGPP